MWREFKEFIARGNVIGLAVAVVVGIAFGAVVTSFTNDILMQLIAAIGAKPSFESYAITLRGTPIRYGAFLNAVITFLIVSLAMFLFVKAGNRLMRQQEKKPVESEIDVLRQIRDSLSEGVKGR